MAARKPLPQNTPVGYEDSLRQRAFPYQFKRIGSPFAFLNDIGVTPILEFLYKGNLLVDVAHELNVSMTALNTWVENEGHRELVEDAEQGSAEGYLALGYRLLRESNNDFDLKKSKEMIRHAQFMAPRKNRKTYGGISEMEGDAATVKYVFNIGSNAPPETTQRIIEGVVARTLPAPPPPRSLTLSITDNGIAHTDTPIGVLYHIDHPTADEPERGPFYDVEATSPQL